MIIKMYSFKDVVANEFGNIFFQANDESAIRTFKNVFNAKDCNMSIEDFVLYRLGEFDNDKGTITSLPQVIIEGKETDLC